jgi:hypothetical protein
MLTTLFTIATAVFFIAIVANVASTVTSSRLYA